MTNSNTTVVHRLIERNLEQYAGFYDHNWAMEFTTLVPARLTDAVDSLCMAWKEASNTHRLPWLMVHQMTGFTEGFIKGAKPHLAQMIEEFKVWMLRELEGSLKRVEKKVVIDSIKKIDQRLRIANHGKDVTFPAMKYWDELVEKSEFQLSISGSQSLAYCALVFAYEWFVVSCFRELGGAENGRPSHEKFWTEFTTLMGCDMKPNYWDDRDVKIARETRNCIAHLGGKAKPELRAESPTIWISPEGIISVQPSDNRELFSVLKLKVDQLVRQVSSRL